MVKQLGGQVALVTGAGRGIGREIALGLARAGMAVGCVGRTAEPINEVAEQAAARSGVAVHKVVADVTDRRLVNAAVRGVEDALGPIDLLVNNAGIRDRDAALPWEADPDDWWKTVETNVRGPFLLAQAVLPGMLRRRRGRVVTLASGVGLRQETEYSAYAVGKAAANRLTDCLAGAVANTGVVVLDLSPGLVRTDMTEGMWPELDADAYGGTEPIVEAVLAVARGELDPLHGRFVHAVKDDVAELAARAGEIAETDARTLRLRTYGPNDPMAE